MWVFTGVSDITRLQKGCLDKAKLGRRANQLLGGTQGALWLPDGFLPLQEHSDDVRTHILGEMPACDARGPSMASLGQPDLTDLDGPRRRRQLVFPFDSEDETQDQVPVVERMRQAPRALDHSPALWSIPATGAGTSAATEAAGVDSKVPPTSFLLWDVGLWGVSLDELW
jgi:hypothetical protein